MNKSVFVTVIAFLMYMPILTSGDEKIKRYLKTNKIKNHKKREFIIDEESQTKLIKNARYILGEVAMYNADRYLGLNMVPVTIILKKTNEKHQPTLSCCSQWIESGEIPIKNTEDFKTVIGEKQWSYMHIFHFIFGQYDRHSGNLIITKNKKLFLIDNEAVANINQYVAAYSPIKQEGCPWVGGVGGIPKIQLTEKDPETFAHVIAQQQDFKKMHEAFPDVDTWTKLDIDNGNCRIWKDRLWRHFYITEDVPPPFTAIISPELLQKIKSLDAKTLASFWPKLPYCVKASAKKEYKELIATFAEQTMKRRDMVVDYFNKHPEDVRDYKN